MSTLGKIVAGVILAPIAILVVGIGGCEAQKAYYDWQVREMCQKDGGATVYERMPVSADLLMKMKGHISGIPVVPHESAKAIEIPVFLRYEDQRIREGNLQVTRTESQIVRRSDAKVLAKVVSYGRSGGDFPFTASHPSYFSCPSGTDVERKVFIIQGVAK